MNIILKNVKKPMVILVVSDCSKVLLDAFCDIFYDNYIGSKVKIKRQKGFLRKVRHFNEKLIFVNIDLTKLQLGSSQTVSSKVRDFELLKTELIETKSILLLKLSSEGSKSSKSIVDGLPYSFVDITYYIKEDGIYFSRYSSQAYPIDQLVRYCKLKKLKSRYKSN